MAKGNGRASARKNMRRSRGCDRSSILEEMYEKLARK